ncbi:Uncharacterised protein [Mycolicibacterium vanbaalenii]|uniref:Uncharacterized protein n=1 Tax=Mycolicibacterium vanbaalenii TaxID=110539 RepID=A0A5S9QZS6_MYCVN|nr:hypothetical protein [Mycolicibacterium vanbaalenii]CAA0124678.1 Uncharacterised protein [Mycolicibacterium vanbaalenii]
MEGDAGASRLNPTEESSAASPEHQPDPTPQEAATDDVVSDTDTRRPTRLGIGWGAGICAVLVLLAAAAIAGGYFALRANDRAEALARSDSAALEAAKDCVAATQAPDTAAMTASQSKILECSTGDFGVQAGLFSSVIAEAYEAANATVAVDELRAAVERHNDDGSINVLVAVRVRISNAEAADQQVGYRLRATMAYDEGQYRIAKLDQVTS